MPALETPWRAGRFRGSSGRPEILFGRVYEDSDIEAAAFRPGSRIFCIASAGCTALRLAATNHVTSVDINPVQLDYAKARAGGAPMRRGSAERLIEFGRLLFPLAGWSKAGLREFMALQEPSAQLDYWRSRLDTRRLRWGMDALFSPYALRPFYAAGLLTSLPANFGAILRSRLERGFGLHPNRTNVYARALLLGETIEEPTSRPASPIRWVRADAAEFLESCPAGSFDAFCLSNILDGAPPSYARRLFAAVRRASAPGGLLVRRSFSEPPPGASENAAAKDRSLLWGLVEVAPTGA